MSNTAPLAKIPLPKPDFIVAQVKNQVAKGLKAIDERPLVKSSLQTIGSAIAAAAVGATLCAPLKTLSLSLASANPIQMKRIITSLAPKQLVPHFQAIATNNLTLLMPQLLASELMEKSPRFANIPSVQKKAISTMVSTVFCTAAFLNQGVASNNRLTTGVPAGLQRLAAERGRAVLLAATGAFMAREACGLTGLTTKNNPALVQAATTVATAADFAFANMSIAGQSSPPGTLRSSAYFVSRSLEANLYFGASKALSSKVGNALQSISNSES